MVALHVWYLNSLWKDFFSSSKVEMAFGDLQLYRWARIILFSVAMHLNIIFVKKWFRLHKIATHEQFISKLKLLGYHYYIRTINVVNGNARMILFPMCIEIPNSLTMNFLSLSVLNRFRLKYNMLMAANTFEIIFRDEIIW